MKYEAYWRTFTRDSDRESLKQLFLCTYGTLFTYGVKLTQDPTTTRDAIQEVFLNLWQYRTRLNPQAKAIPYLLRAVRNELVRIEKQFRGHADLTDETSKLTFLPHEFQDPVLDASERALILETLNRLPSRQREILYLRFYENLSFEDIATVLGINYQSAVNQSFRAISRLRKFDVLRRFHFSG
jgi:RNA polymerase sigma factor (sigma-70 family)